MALMFCAVTYHLRGVIIKPTWLLCSVPLLTTYGGNNKTNMALMFCAVTYHLQGNNKTNMALMFCAVTYHLRG